MSFAEKFSQNAKRSNDISRNVRKYTFRHAHRAQTQIGQQSGQASKQTDFQRAPA